MSHRTDLPEVVAIDRQVFEAIFQDVTKVTQASLSYS